MTDDTRDLHIENNVQDQDIPFKDNHIFHAELNSFLKESEKYRLTKMQIYQSRKFATLCLTLASVVLGASGFGWFLLVEGNITYAVLCMFIVVLPQILLAGWTNEPVRTYKTRYKNRFMPKLADMLGGLKFYPKRGISQKILLRTGIMPKFTNYRAEDCFAGKCNNAKITLSEAKLFLNKKTIFDGVFVFIDLQKDVFHGHSIITANGKLAHSLQKKYQKKSINYAPYDAYFSFLSSEDKTSDLSNEALFSKLHATSSLFNNAELSAVFLKKYIFMMIPFDDDMFEASDVYIPIATNEAATQCKKEVERILSIIDIIDLYK